MKQLLIASALLFAGACAHGDSGATPARAKAAAAAGKDNTVASKDANHGHLVCEMETPVGSHFPQRVCHSDGDDVTDRNRQEMQDGLRGAAQGNQAFGAGGR